MRSLIILSCGMLLIRPCSVRDPQTPNHESGTLSFSHCLSSAGVKYDCYFTIEQMPLDVGNWIESSQVSQDVMAGSLDQMILSLKRLFEGRVIIRRSIENPAIVEIVDARLEKAKKYGLEERVDLHYAGGIQGLDDELARKGASFRGRRHRQIPNEMIDDMTTQVTIRAKNLPVRRLLTDYVPLSQYGRILWVANTRIVSGEAKTTIRFNGPRGNAEERGIERKFPVDFRSGEIAYLLASALDADPKRKQAAEAARSFVSSAMNTGRTLNVRWAMLFLGDIPSAEGAELLVRHIDYRYTTCGVTEESFPAVRALTELGKPASEAALTEISKESNSLRSDLLARVIFNVEGPDKAPALVIGVLNTTVDNEQRKRLQTVVSHMKEWRKN
jgi:hypothetical protein